MVHHQKNRNTSQVYVFNGVLEKYSNKRIKINCHIAVGYELLTNTYNFFDEKYI